MSTNDLQNLGPTLGFSPNGLDNVKSMKYTTLAAAPARLSIFNCDEGFGHYRTGSANKNIIPVTKLIAKPIIVNGVNPINGLMGSDLANPRILMSMISSEPNNMIRPRKCNVSLAGKIHPLPLIIVLS